MILFCIYLTGLNSLFAEAVVSIQVKYPSGFVFDPYWCHYYKIKSVRMWVTLR